MPVARDQGSAQIGADAHLGRAVGGAGLYATRAWKAGDLICALDGIAQAYPSRYSIQVARTEHLMPPLRAVAQGNQARQEAGDGPGDAEDPRGVPSQASVPTRSWFY